MAILPIPQCKVFHLFLNISFLFLVSIFLITRIRSPTLHLLNQCTRPISEQPKTILSQPLYDSKDGCKDLQRYKDIEAKCAFVRCETQCKSKGYIDYLQLFYCTFGHYAVLGYIILVLWLLVLFYLLGNTASYYFCSSLESLSTLLKLSPTIAGVTLLALGNGAPDVFSSIVSFTGPDAGHMGINSILGGGFFVSTVVIGIISILVSDRRISLDKSSFIRDLCFYLLTLFYLLVILIVGRINSWGAMGFASLYIVYLFVVSTTHFCRRKDGMGTPTINPELPISRGMSPFESTEFDDLAAPLFDGIVEEDPPSVVKEAQHNDFQMSKRSCCGLNSSVSYYSVWILYVLELPLYLSRRMTIPVVSEEGWSKPFAVISVTLAPVLLTVLWNSQEGEIGTTASLIIYTSSGLVGICSGILAFLTTNKCSPPKRFLFPWLAGGFLMSVAWSYITAQELVALLISLGNIIGISPSVLGVTVLAWGNSIGDFIADVSLAINGGPDGIQTAISSCYAGPIFETVVGLGLSLVLSTWHVYPSSYVVPTDQSSLQTLGFLVGGLLWALLILSKKDMRLDRVLGGGLLAIYLCFLTLRLVCIFGLI